MNAKSFTKKAMKKPLQPSFIQSNRMPSTISKVNSRNSSGGTSSATPTAHSLYDAISSKPVSVEEHNKVLFQNQRLAKENANLKSYISNYKLLNQKTSTELNEMRYQLSEAHNEIEKLKSDLKKKEEPKTSLASDQFKTALNLLMEDYLAIDSIRNQINEFGGRVETVKGIMSSLQSMIDCDNNCNESENLEPIADHFDQSLPSNNSMRLSLSSQENRVMRRLSSERVRRDFQILNELSTIFEMSSEHRVSSLGGIRSDIISAENNKIQNSIQSEGINTRDMVDICSVSTSTANPPTLDNESKSGKTSKSKTKAVNTTKPKTKSKTETNPKKKIEKQIKSKPKSQTKANELNISVYDFTEDEENKENVVPSGPLPQRHSKRIRSNNYSVVKKNFWN